MKVTFDKKQPIQILPEESEILLDLYQKEESVLFKMYITYLYEKYDGPTGVYHTNDLAANVYALRYLGFKLFLEYTGPIPFENKVVENAEDIGF